MSQTITVKPVVSSSDLNLFLKLAWKLNTQTPNWVAPKMFDIKHRFDKKHHHFFDHAEGEYFIAWRGNQPVGRITAHFDYNHDLHWGGHKGHFGWFESENAPEVARALFEAASDWLRKNGRDKIQGPFNFNINEECGLLIDGFDTPPMFMMTHNPPYHQKLIEDLGFTKAQDLYAYRLDATAEPPADIVKFAESVRAREDVVIRPWNMKDHANEMKRWLEIYNSAWEKNWGSVKLTEAEFLEHTFELRFLADPELIFMAETKAGEIMGCAFSFPNLNEYIGPANGHLPGLLPFRWYDMVVRKKFSSLRVVTLGVKEEFRRSGVGAVFYYDTLMAAKRKGYKWGEMSWILESNGPMNRAIQHMGGTVYKTYRIYEKAL